MPPTAPIEVAAYYFPNYHVDPHNEKVHGRGWTEWELVKQAQPRFPGHQQPKAPAWGYGDEADPRVFARKLDAAADHGVTSFIFDWYWYNDGPFLQRGLEEGYLRAANRDRIKIALMWANHDWIDIHPAKHGGHHRLLYPGAVTPATFETMTDYVIERYFSQPSYWRIDGKPYFSVYELYRLVEGFGGIDGTRAALQRYRDKARAAGHPGVHLNAVVWGVQILPGEKAVSNPRELLAALGFDSVTSYVWIHHVPLKPFPECDYAHVMVEAEKYWQRAASEFGLPYHPNVTMGWDASPRTVQSDKFEDVGYPFMSTIRDNTPERFKEGLQRARRFVERDGGTRIVTLNAWNEWTEGSYLEPDRVNGMKYLEAIRDVFTS